MEDGGRYEMGGMVGLSPTVGAQYELAEQRST